MSARILGFGVVAAVLFGASARADLTLRGQFLYKDRQYTNSGWTGTFVDRPIRHAAVQVIEEGGTTVFASGATDESGILTLTVPASSPLSFRIVCFTHVGDGSLGPKTFRVTDAGSPAAEYSVSSDVIFAPDPDAEILFGTVTADEILLFPNNPPTSQFLGNPFNMLDQIVWSLQYALASGAPPSTKNFQIRWPDITGTNAPCVGDNAIVALHYSTGDCDPVILHELGHGLQFTYSSILLSGTPHFLYQCNQDPQEAFREGLAHFFAGSVQSHRGDAGPFAYLSLLATVQNGYLNHIIRLEDGYPYMNVVRGEASESAIAFALWDIADTVSTNDGDGGLEDDLLYGIPFAGGLSGNQVLWLDLLGPFKVAPYSTVAEFWNGMFVPTNHGNFRATKLVFDAWGMRFYEDADEPDDVVAEATPLALDSWTATHTLYTSSSIPAVPGNGDRDVFSFTLTSGENAEVETRYPGGATDAKTYCDPYLTVRAPDGSLVGQTGTGGFDRNAKLSFTAASSGTYTAEVRAVSSNSPPTTLRALGSYELRARVLP